MCPIHRSNGRCSELPTDLHLLVPHMELHNRPPCSNVRGNVTSRGEETGDALKQNGSSGNHGLRRGTEMYVEINGGVFDLPSGLESAYGSFAGYDIRTAQGLLQYLIRFANRPLARSMLDDANPSRAARPIGQEQLRNLLSDAVYGPSSSRRGNFANPSDDFLREIRQRLAHVKWTPVLERTSAGARWVHHGVLPDLASFEGLIETLLRDEGIRRILAHCRYRVCGNFFLQSNRTLYCSDDCMKAAHTQDSAERKNKQRARRYLVSRGYSKEQVHAAVEHAVQDHPDTKAKELALYAEKQLQRRSSSKP